MDVFKRKILEDLLLIPINIYSVINLGVISEFSEKYISAKFMNKIQ